MRITTRTKHRSGTQSMAWLLLLVFCFNLVLPATRVYAGGPTQPEVQGFTPIGVSSMVDPFTGDFTYNIPLMDVEGYPINIAYNSGISMDQEASWVGLGWNLNMGSIVRSMRGLPDDFNGDLIEKTQTQKPNTTIGLDFGAGIEVFGKDLGKLLDLSASLGVTYNNYNGYGTQFNFGSSFSFGKQGGRTGTAGFQLSGSSENGASFAPSVSFSQKTDLNEAGNLKATSTIGSSMNSRTGLSYISYSQSMKASASDAARKEHSIKDVSGKVNGSYDLGLHTYSPTVSPSMLSFSLSGNWKIAATIFGFDGSFDIGLSYSRQWIPTSLSHYTNKGFGYFNLQNGQNDEHALLDFNRDNDGAFTKYTPNLPSAHLTYDIFSTQAQGASGSYRGFRNEVGYVFDPKNTTTSATGGVGIETGFGNLTDIGVDATFNVMFASSGAWNNDRNKAAQKLVFEDVPNQLETYAMQEANERSVDDDRLFQQQFLDGMPVLFPLGGSSLRPIAEPDVVGKIGAARTNIADNNRNSRIKRNQVLSFLTIAEVRAQMGLNGPVTTQYGFALDHHIGEITQLETDGRRYVFGLPAYNHFQEEVTFAIGKSLSGSPVNIKPDDLYDGLVNYRKPILASTTNDQGIDNYYSSTRTPGYAHSFLLTAVLSDDYIDVDGVKGPSDDDLGSYVKFGYDKVSNYQWRTPIAANTGFFNEGLKSDLTDDKASFIHGEKDLWYVTGVETKNYVAVFELEKREDAVSVKSRNGGLAVGTDKNSMRLLRKIKLYSKPEYEAHKSDLSKATSLQEVNFVYDYSLCQNYPGNASGAGKLTLKEIYFTYQGSLKMKRSPYTFEYPNNPEYNMKAVDRWGSYMPAASGSTANLASPMNNADYPYTNQDRAASDANAAAWCLQFINLPSGGRIKVDYEADDYAYVQHLPAQRMFKIIGVEGDVDLGNNPAVKTISNGSTESTMNKELYFKLNDPNDDVSKYMTAGRQLYFRCLVAFRETEGDDSPTKYDYVSGYGKVKSVTKVTANDPITGDPIALGKIKLEGERLLDNGDPFYSPVTKSAIQFGRLHMSRYIFDQPLSNTADGSEQSLLAFANSVVSAFTSFGEFFTGPNKAIYEKNRGVEIVTNKSWIRLDEPTGHKIGGGVRVHKISMSDNWNYMIDAADGNYDYGQEFTYATPDGRSSGVASYEPQIGGDENPWHQPALYSEVKRFAPDDKLYIESPVMESQFPNPTVGYSYVEIKDLTHKGVTRTATGKVVKEFFTARDFPTIVGNSDLDTKTANSFLPLLPKYQFLAASQGFTIELNDMHGKPKRESVYAENKSQPISSVEYFYQQEPVVLNSIAASKLRNNVQIINQDGTTGESIIGTKYEGVADFRQSEMSSYGGSIDFNTNSFLVAIFPGFVPTIWPQIDISETRFQSSTMNKVIHRFGILEKTVANQDGSIVEMSNLAYDAESGEVLVTQTTTDFNDKIYSMHFPAFWKYDQMGPAYRNIGYTYGKKDVTVTGGITAINPSLNYFSEGDEVMITSAGGVKKGWITYRTSGSIILLDKAGNAIDATSATIKVIRSGRRNKQLVSMANVTALADPRAGLVSNNYAKVLNAGAVGFNQDWQTYCHCFPSTAKFQNPYATGNKGNWRPSRSYTHLSGRTQADFDKNTNIRRDGVFTSFTPYYKLENKDWEIDGQNWTYVSEVTVFSPNGMTLETRDALGRYSASKFGFNNTLTTAVASNTQLRQLEFNGFEDDQFSNCTDQNLFATSNASIVPGVAHSGRKSIKVPQGGSLTFSNVGPYCPPVPSCNLTLTAGNVTATNATYIPSGGIAPYHLETELISGTGDAFLAQDGTISVKYDNTYRFEMLLKLTDGKDCTTQYHVFTTGTGPTLLKLEIIIGN